MIRSIFLNLISLGAICGSAVNPSKIEFNYNRSGNLYPRSENDTIHEWLLTSNLAPALNDNLANVCVSPVIANDIAKWIEKKYMIFRVMGENEATYLGEAAGILSTEPVKNLKDIHFFICTPRDYQRISDSRHLVLQYLEVPYEIDDISNLWHFLRNLLYAPEGLEFTAVKVQWESCQKKIVLRILFDQNSGAESVCYMGDCFGEMKIYFDLVLARDASVLEHMVVKQMVQLKESSWMASIWLSDDRNTCPLYFNQSDSVFSILSFELSQFVHLNAKQLIIHKIKFDNHLSTLHMFKLVGKFHILQKNFMTYLSLVDYGDVKLFNSLVLSVERLVGVSPRPNRETGINDQNELLVFYDNVNDTYAKKLHEFVTNTYIFERDCKIDTNFARLLNDKPSVVMLNPPYHRKILPESLQFFKNPRLLIRTLSTYRDYTKNGHTIYISFGFQSLIQNVDPIIIALNSQTKLVLSIVFRDEEKSDLFARLFFMSFYNILRPGAFSMSHKIVNIDLDTSSAPGTYYYAWQTLIPTDNQEIFSRVYDAFLAFLRAVGIAKKHVTDAFVGSREIDSAAKITFGEPAQSAFSVAQKHFLTHRISNLFSGIVPEKTRAPSNNRERVNPKKEDTNTENSQSRSIKKDHNRPKILPNASDENKTKTKILCVDLESSQISTHAQRIKSKKVIEIDWSKLEQWIRHKVSSKENYFLSLMSTDSDYRNFSLSAYVKYRGSRLFSPNVIEEIFNSLAYESSNTFLAVSFSKFDSHMTFNQGNSLTITIPKKPDDRIANVFFQLGKLLLKDVNRHPSPLWIGVRSDQDSKYWSIVLGFDPALGWNSLYNYLIAKT